MTRAEALAEARRRWGPDAWAGYDRRIGWFMVQSECAGGGPFGESPDSYEAAFADADRRAGGAGTEEGSCYMDDERRDAEGRTL